MTAKRINVVIIHGTLGTPAGNWYPWLKQKLEAQGHNVALPHFPTPEGRSLSAWAEIVQDVLKKFDPASTLLIGHSMGAGLALYLTEITAKPYKAVFAICPFLCDLGLEPYDTLNASFTHRIYAWNRIRKNADKILCMAGDNDPYVPLAYSQDVANHLGVALSVIENGGHLNAESGYLEFALLVDKIEQVI